MKKSKYRDGQIITILKQAKNGVSVADLCREHGMSSASFYKRRSKFGGITIPGKTIYCNGTLMMLIRR